MLTFTIEPRPVGLCLKHHYQTSDSECCEYAKERGKNERRGLHGESTDVCLGDAPGG